MSTDYERKHKEYLANPGKVTRETRAKLFAGYKPDGSPKWVYEEQPRYRIPVNMNIPTNIPTGIPKARSVPTTRSTPLDFLDGYRAVLGVPAGCTDMTIIKKKYRKLAKKYHPDKYSEAEASKAEASKAEASKAEDKFVKINEAYEILCKNMA